MAYTRVGELAELVSESSDSGDWVVLVYRVAEVWRVEVRSALDGLDIGPESMTITAGEAGIGVDPNEAREVLLTTELLRAIPMQDIRRRIKRQKTEWAQANGYMAVIPARFSSDRDFAVLASAYASRAAAGEKNPIKNMANVYGISRNTLSARIRVARERGLLTRPTPDNRGELTEKARLLIQEGGQDG